MFDSDVKPDDSIQAIVDRWKGTDRSQVVTVTFADKTRFPLIQCADLYAGEERLTWLDYDIDNIRAPGMVRAVSSGALGRGMFWSLKTQERIKEILDKYRRGEIPTVGR